MYEQPKKKENKKMAGNISVENSEKLYEAVVTDRGNELMMNAVANGRKVAITEFAVGDGNGAYYRPSTDMTALKKEVWRGPINSCEISSEAANVLIVTAVCPGAAGGFTIREMGVFDTAGNMIAVCNSPAIPKVTITDGVVNEMRLEMEIALLNGEAVELVVDPNIVTATKADLERLREEMLRMGRVTIGTAAGAFQENEIRFIANEMPY